jgi:hypothetical protein
MFRRVWLLVPAILLACLAAGCGVGQADIERSIRDEMKSKMGVVITSFDLKKQGDGSYVGTATAQSGDVYDVTTETPKGDTIQWKAVPGQAMVDKIVRDGMEQQLGAKVKTLQLTRKGPGNYTGPAELVTGVKMNVSTHMDGMQLLWEAKPATP